MTRDITGALALLNLVNSDIAGKFTLRGKDGGNLQVVGFTLNKICSNQEIAPLRIRVNQLAVAIQKFCINIDVAVAVE